MGRLFEKKKNRGLSAALIVAFFTAVFALICLLDALPELSAGRNFLVGLFGVATVAYAIFIILAAPMLFLGYKIVAKKTTVIKFAAFFIVFLLFLQAITSNTIINGKNFIEYCTACFDSGKTAGGLIFAVLNYPIHSLLGGAPAAAIYIIVGLGLLVSIVLPYFYRGNGGVRSGIKKNKKTPVLTDLRDGKEKTVVREQARPREDYSPNRAALKIGTSAISAGSEVNRSHGVAAMQDRPLVSGYQREPARLYESRGYSVHTPNSNKQRGYLPPAAGSYQSRAALYTVEPENRGTADYSVGRYDSPPAARYVKEPDIDKKGRAMAVLYENADKKISVDNSQGYEVIAVRKKEEEIKEELKDELSDYTNNGRLRTIVENRLGGGVIGVPPFENRTTDRYEERSDGQLEEKLDGYGDDQSYSDYALKKHQEENVSLRPESFERFEAEEGSPLSGDIYEDYNIIRSRDGSSMPHGKRRSSMLGNNMDEIREEIRRETLLEKAELEKQERIRREGERENREKEYRSGARKFGFVDDDIDDNRVFVNTKRQEEELAAKKKTRIRTPRPTRSADAREADGYRADTFRDGTTEEYAATPFDGDTRGEYGASPLDGDTRGGYGTAPLKGDTRGDYGAAPYGTTDGRNPSPFREEYPPVEPYKEPRFDGYGSRQASVGEDYKTAALEIPLPQTKRIELKLPQKKKPDEQMTFEALRPVKKSPYNAPPIDLLLDYPCDGSEDAAELEANVRKLEACFNDFKISAVSCGVQSGPTFTRYEMKMPGGVSVNRVVSLDNDISMRLATKNKVRIEAPIPGKDAFGIEIPNKKRSIVGMRDLVNDTDFVDGDGHLLFTLGKDISGKNYYGDLADMPHLLIAGSTGSGKSCCLNSFIVSLLYKYDPDDVRLILIDPKQVELSIYEGLPHLLLHDIITEDEKVINALDWAIKEMHRRYGLIKANKSNKIDEYNKKVSKAEKMYRIVIVVDEVAELMTKLKRELEDRIKSLSQLARAAGIHIVLATQRPSVDIITGVIKSNMPSRIAFAVTSAIDSRTILDKIGAEKLLGKGDMLYQAQSMPEPMRLQGVFIGNSEIGKVVDYIRQNNEAYYDSDIDVEINTVKEEAQAELNQDEDGFALDPLFVKAALLVIENNSASISLLQRKFAIGYTRAARIVDVMEDRKIIGKGDGAKPRGIQMTMEEFCQVYKDLIEDV